MKTHRAECTTVTDGPYEFVDITERVQNALEDARIRHGHVTVFCRDGGCSLVVNERESGLLSDVKTAGDHLSRSSRSDPHAMIGSRSIVLPVVDGKLQLGTWQRVLVVELQQPATRELVVQIMGE